MKHLNESHVAEVAEKHAHFRYGSGKFTMVSNLFIWHNKARNSSFHQKPNFLKGKLTLAPTLYFMPSPLLSLPGYGFLHYLCSTLQHTALQLVIITKLKLIMNALKPSNQAEVVEILWLMRQASLVRKVSEVIITALQLLVFTGSGSQEDSTASLHIRLWSIFLF